MHEDIKKKIKSTLQESDLDFQGLSESSKEDLLLKLSVYHEELFFQNEELKVINQELRALKSKYQKLFDEGPIPYFVMKETTKIIACNDAYKRLFFDKSKPLVENICSFDQDRFYFFMKDLIQKDRAQKDVFSFIHKDSAREIQLFISRVEDEENHYIGAMMDMTALQEYEKHVYFLSYHDPLTGLYNRRYLEEAMINFNKSKYHPIAIVMADLNGLKLVNDAFGHSKGDELLKETAKVIQSVCKKSDIAARVGGDEFTILFMNTSEEAMGKILHQLRETSKGIGVSEMVLSVAYGYDIKENIQERFHDGIKKAEENMYQNKLMHQTSHRRQVFDGILSSLHEKYPREEDHSTRVGGLAILLGNALKFNDSQLRFLKTSAQVHDIGKIALDHHIIEKPELLSQEEYNMVKKHPEMGYRILLSSNIHTEMAEVILAHHERMDGKGYPRNLKGEEIPIEARILTICDAFDAMTSERPYRKALTLETAIEELKNGMATQFDPELTKLFIALIKDNKI
jgi:diguanylate cyclase (GGDEF)-like protein